MTNVLKYINELANSNNALQIMVFDDDSVEVQFRDGSSLQLSPCGSCYQYISSDAILPVALESDSVVRRRCCFATSETKSKVDFAVFWRNHFARRPYLPSNFEHLYTGALHSHKDITSFTWPDHIELGKKNCDGKEENAFISAEDDFAKLSLSKNGHFCEVDHLVKFSSKTDHFSAEGTKDVGKVNCTNKPTRKYIWLKHIFPPRACPMYWKYPLSVALSSIDDNELADHSFEKHLSSQLINSNHAPQPIPSICKLQFSHTWRFHSEKNKSGLCLPSDSLKQASNASHPFVPSIKTLWNAGVLYWTTKRPKDNHVALEAWLSNGSVLLSNPTSNYYFTHLKFENEKVEKRVYSATALPMNSDLKTVILRAIRLYSYAEQVLNDCSRAATTRFCWQENTSGFGNYNNDGDSPCRNELNDLYETVYVAGLGKFSAVKSSVQILFDDGAVLYVALDQALLDSLQTSSDALSSVPCRLLFPEGQHLECHGLAQTDSHLAGYLEPTCDWLSWLAKSKQQRSAAGFYSDSTYSCEKLDSIHSELEKISKFTRSVEQDSNRGSVDRSPIYSVTKLQDIQQLSTQDKGNSSAIAFAPSEIANVLETTSRAIADLDGFIQSMRDIK